MSLLERSEAILAGIRRPEASALAVRERAEATNGTAAADPLADLKQKVHERLIQDLEHSKLKGRSLEEQRATVEDAARVILGGEDVAIARQERLRLISEIADEVVGYGPIEPLLQDPSISEVMVNRCNQIYYERKGQLHLSDRTFRDDAHIMRIIERIIAPLGRRLDESSPMVDARLPDGSRVNAIIPPLTLNGPSITIRKFAKDPLKVEDLIALGSMSAGTARFLAACVEARLNIIVSGGTGSGKTTLLNVLSSFIPANERIVTIEDPAELQMRQPHVVRLETRPPNIEGKGQITTRDLVRNALRMRPDRIIVGEVRSGEAFDMLQAMNTGHDGSLTTVHANAPRDALSRIENMVLMAGLELPVKAIREQVASAVHVVIQQQRMRDGSRKVTHVTEVVGMEGQVITLQDLFVFEQHSLDREGRVTGRMRSTGLRPKFFERFEQHGIHLPPETFQ